MTPDQFRVVADHFPQAALLLTKDGIVVAANSAVSALGWSAEDSKGQALAALSVSPRQVVGEYLRLCSRSREPVIGSLELSVGSTSVSALCYGKLVRYDPTGAGTLLLLRLVRKESAPSEFAVLNQKIAALTEEIRRRRQVEERLREQSEWLAVTLSSIGDGVITTDEVGNVKFLNPVAERLTGWRTEEAAGLSLDQVFRIVNEHTRQTVENPASKVLREGVVAGLANHTVLISRDGFELPIDDSGAPIRNEVGQIAGVVLIFRDVTERKRTEEELVQASRRKDEFLAMLAHELRNPLAPIRSGLDLLSLSDVDPEVVGPMQGQVEHLVRLVDDLLDVSRIIRNRVELKKAVVDLRDVVDRAVETVRNQIDAKRQALSVRLPSKPTSLVADPVRLAQIVANLLHNASKYNEDSGEISIEARIEADQVVIEVRDSGVGIEPELLPHVFDLFTQASRSVDRSQGGLGIGLTVVKSLVELHDGSVEAYSEGPGQGAEFTIRLPVLASAAAEPAIDETEARIAQAARILVVDDNVPAAKMLEKLLRRLGAHEIALAHDGAEALETARRFAPEIVLLDIGLPRMDGHEVARALRRLPAYDRTLIVALTGYGAEDDRKKSVASGCDGHLVKPPALKDLLDVLNHPKLRKQ